jgi:hypothetical protein
MPKEVKARNWRLKVNNQSKYLTSTHNRDTTAAENFKKDLNKALVQKLTEMKMPEDGFVLPAQKVREIDTYLTNNKDVIIDDLMNMGYTVIPSPHKDAFASEEAVYYLYHSYHLLLEREYKTLTRIPSPI